MFHFSSVAQTCPTLWPHELQHARPPCPSPTPSPWSSLKLMSIELVMPSSHLILCRPLLLLPPIPPSINLFPKCLLCDLLAVRESYLSVDAKCHLQRPLRNYQNYFNFLAFNDKSLIPVKNSIFWKQKQMCHTHSANDLLFWNLHLHNWVQSYVERNLK